MTTGMESQQSGSFVIYYKGVSLTITQRDPSLDMKPLIDESMKNIDYALFLGALPSWNKETNKEAIKPASIAPAPETQQVASATHCAIHNKEMKQRSFEDKTWYDHRQQENGVWKQCRGEGWK